MTAKLNEPAPDFELPDLNGSTYRLSEYRGNIVVVDFWSAECPISRDYDDYFNEFVERFGSQEDVVLLAIDSNSYDNANVLEHALETRDLDFPVLRDRGNEIADKYDAKTTPHVFIVDENGMLRYRGHVDDRSWQQKEATTNYIEPVVNALLEGEAPPVQEKPHFGCTINREIVRTNGE